jgi:hypothetical protein
MSNLFKDAIVACMSILIDAVIKGMGFGIGLLLLIKALS